MAKKITRDHNQADILTTTMINVTLTFMLICKEHAKISKKSRTFSHVISVSCHWTQWFNLKGFGFSTFSKAKLFVDLKCFHYQTKDTRVDTKYSLMGRVINNTTVCDAFWACFCVLHCYGYSKYQYFFNVCIMLQLNSCCLILQWPASRNVKNKNSNATKMIKRISVKNVQHHRCVL